MERKACLEKVKAKKAQEVKSYEKSDISWIMIMKVDRKFDVKEKLIVVMLISKILPSGSIGSKMLLEKKHKKGRMKG